MCIFEHNRLTLIFLARIRSCGNSALSKAKSSIQNYIRIIPMVSPCFLLMRDIAARIRN